MISSIGSSGHVDLFSAPLAGVRRGMQQAATAAASIAQGEVTPENVVLQIQAEMLVKANTVSMRTADEIFQSLLDTTA